MQILTQREPRTREPHYLSREVCHAAGISGTLLRAWTNSSRGCVLLSSAERPVSRQWVPVLFSWARMMQIAIMRELCELSWFPGLGSQAAAVFCDAGDIGDEIPGAFGPRVPTRMPAELFPEGRTILAARLSPGDGADAIAEVHQVRDDESFGDVWQRLTGGVPGISLIDCNAVVDNVKQKLGIE